MAAQAPTEPGAGEKEGASELPPAEFEPGLDTRPPPIPVSDEDAASARKTLQEHLETDEYKHLQQAAAVTVDDACIRRYMVAKRQSVDAAVRGILATLQWRMDTIPDPLQCTTCCTTPSSHCFEFVGHDWFGRPVIYGCPTRASNVSPLRASTRQAPLALSHHYHPLFSVDNRADGSARRVGVRGCGC